MALEPVFTPWGYVGLLGILPWPWILYPIVNPAGTCPAGLVSIM